MSETSPATSRRLRWERATSLPLMVLAVLFLGVYAWQVLDTGASPHLDTWLTVVDVTIWAAFLVDFAVRLALSGDRWRFLRTHPIDLLIVLLPPFRPLRLLRAAMLVLGSLNRNTTTRARLSVFVGSGSVLVLLLCSLAFFDAEHDAPDTKITGFGDALWWAVVSVTTVGYGDVYPVTTEGRLISLILMTFGIGLISFAIGTTTSWVLDQLKTVEANVENTDREIGALVAEVRALRAEMAALRANAGHATPTTFDTPTVRVRDDADPMVAGGG
ncbi:potassium channel family protein [Nocardia takedensis]|uniref:potassium channel family protein n=1 Tax=Nocardia takedensis TaxID=259390 RepID=UPI000314E6D3|nr:potassium channel family protein [Nocardia takedensis]